MKSGLLSGQPGAHRRPPWPEGPAHQLARRLGVRSPRRLPISTALKLADAMGTTSYGKAMAAWEAEKKVAKTGKASIYRV